MINEIVKVFGDRTAEILFEIITECMDDYLYIFDLQNNTFEISQSAVKRFNISSNVLTDATNEVMKVVYEEDRRMLTKHLADVCAGKEKVHNLHYRWIDKEGMPVWINCRGIVIEDTEGNAEYLIGCLNETGNKRRADNVTGLLGGPEFLAYLQSQREPITKGFFMHIGIDDFGVINGSQGADYGNYILKSVADCMKECLSDKQRIYHLVADQYVIVDLEASLQEEAAKLKSKITDRLHDFIVSEHYEAVFSISVGVVDATTFCEGVEECRKKFEFVLKQAKSMGKNGFYIFAQDDYEAFLRKGRIVAALRNAIVNNYNGFEVNYQPIVDCQSEQIIGAEALMRFSMMSDEGREVISPVEFIPLLEESGLMIPAGRYILNEAAEMCSEMQQYIQDFRMNINVSYVQILQGNVERDIMDAIQKYALKPECICVEMTESGYMDMTPSFCKFRKTLDKNRISFVIDDFGTGYSNLHCIRDMNPSYVKMDRDFTAKAMNSARDYELYKNIIPMVHGINVRICTEGIEEKEWCLKMKELKVDYLQGYFLGRPCGKERFLQQYAKGINVK
ncbi:EAL domain-containing protein [Roseburia sp. BX1005]|uniref:EAL domain-containing protein n=1 Tax=Roseburia zhanii TaxID=2763064 RepID=A0A923RUA4_9FIRM|nr:EAL domain-containing protein [Roseburia zhanii]